jgi:hypothetical protein
MKKLTINNTEEMFNITKLIFDNYNNGTPISYESLSHIDFLEISKKTVRKINSDGNSDFMILEASLCNNIISLLPIEYYKQYIQLNWMYSGIIDSYLTKQAIGMKKFDYLNFFLMKGDELLHNNSNSEDINDYVSYVLNPILDIYNNLNNYTLFSNNNNTTSTHIIQQYKSIFYSALEQFEYLTNNNPNVKRKFNKELWFIDYSFIHKGYQIQLTKNAIINICLTNDIIYDFFQDICQQHINTHNSLFTKQNLKIAFQAGNNKVVNYLNNQLQPNADFFNILFQETMKNLTETIQTNFNRSHKTKISPKTILNIFTMSHQFIKDFTEFKASDVINLFLIDNKLITNALITMIPQIKTDKIINDFTLSEILYANNMFNIFIKQNKYKPINKSIVLDLTNSLKKAFPDIPLHIDSDRKLAIHEFIVTEFLPTLPNKQKRNEYLVNFRTFTLEKDLPLKLNKALTIKI